MCFIRNISFDSRHREESGGVRYKERNRLDEEMARRWPLALECLEFDPKSQKEALKSCG